MTYTVQYHVPNGALPEINRTRETMPDAEPSEVILQWVTNKFGGYISANITQAYRFENARPDRFDIVFEQEQHARVFVRDVGGRLK